MLEEIIAACRKEPECIDLVERRARSVPEQRHAKGGLHLRGAAHFANRDLLGSILMRGWGRPDYQAGVFSQQGYLDTYPGDFRASRPTRLCYKMLASSLSGTRLSWAASMVGFSKRWFSVAKETWEDVRTGSLLDGAEAATEHCCSATANQPERSLAVAEASSRFSQVRCWEPSRR